MSELWLRAGRAVITPSTPGGLAGYAARHGESEGTHDELEANLVVLGEGATATAWLALDAVAVTAELSRALADIVRIELRMPALAVQVCASHTHSAPIGWTGPFYPGHTGSADERLRAELFDAVRSLARHAHESPPVSVYAEWSSSALAGVAAGRLVADHPVEPSLGVLAVRAQDDGSLRAVVFDFANHPTVLDATNRQWSGDWPSAARSVISAAHGAARAFGEGRVDAPVLVFLQGAAGDLSTRFVRRGSGFAEAARIGALVGLRVLELLEQGGRRLSGALALAGGELELPTRALPTVEESAESLRRAREIAAESAADPGRARLALARVQGAEIQHALAVAAPGSSASVSLTVVTLGELSWAHAPLELFSSLAVDLSTRVDPAEVRFVGYCNGYAGYLPDAAAYDSGSYEALTSMLDPSAVALVLDTFSQLIPAQPTPKEHAS